MKYIKYFKVFEDHQQGELLFDNPHGDPVRDKPEHSQVLDAFIEFSKKTNFKGSFISEGNYGDYLTGDLIKKSVQRMFNTQEGDLMDFYWKFFQNNPPEENPEYYNKKWFKNNDVEFTADGILRSLETPGYEEAMSEEGEKEFMGFRENMGEELLGDNGLIGALDSSDKEGVSIYRSFFVKKKDAYSIISKYSGAGYYWTFDEDKPESYSGDYQGSEYILYGKVRFQDINWEETCIKNMYNLREEKEIEVSGGAIIKIERILHKESEKFLPLSEPIYVTS